MTYAYKLKQQKQQQQQQQYSRFLSSKLVLFFKYRWNFIVLACKWDIVPLTRETLISLL